MEGYLHYAFCMFEEFEPLQGKRANTPAKKHLFTINEDAEALPMDKKDMFHSIVALLLFMPRRARPDIQSAIAFLCTQLMFAD